MPFLLLLLSAGLAALALRRYVGLIRYRRAAASRGCQPAQRYRHLDPFFGLDVIFTEIYGVATDSNLTTLTQKLQKYGSTFETETLGRRTIWSKDPQLIEAVWGSHEKDWGYEPYRFAPMEPFCGPGFITTDGDLWEHSRRLLKPTFTKANLSDLRFFGIATDALLESVPRDGRTVDLQELLYSMYLDTASQFILGKSMGVTVEKQKVGSIIQSKDFLAEFHNSLQGMAIRLITGELRDLLPRSSWDRSCAAVHRFLDDLIDPVIAETRQDWTDGQVDANSKRYHSLLEGLSRETKDRAEIRNHLIQGMLAAQDTTSVLIANALYLLARHPDVWSRVRLEAASLAGFGFAMDNLLNSRLLRNVIMESKFNSSQSLARAEEMALMKPALRLYPVFSNLTRAALRDTVLPCGGGPDGKSPLFVPKGSGFDGVFYALHREESIYGQRTESFDPDRWDTIKPTPFEFMAFGQGRRRCLGQQKAQMEAAYVICRLALIFETLTHDGTQYAGAERITTRNARGCRLGFIAA